MKKEINRNILKTILILFSLLIFLASLTFDAFSYEYQGVKMMSSISCFVMGSLAILGGGTLEWLIWLANPLCLISIFCLVMDKNIASKFNFAALILALSFYSWNSVLASESGTSGEILSVELGYFIWLASITTLTFGTQLYFRKYREIKYFD